MRRGWSLTIWALACVPATPPTPPPTSPTVSPPTAKKPVDECPADCWTALADVAAQVGDLDVAASHRGRAFARDATTARLSAWIDALLAGGELEHARRALTRARVLHRNDADLLAEVDRRLAALPPARIDPDTASPPLSSPALLAAYTAEAAGRLDEAAALLAAAHGDDPYHLARAGDLTARRGDEPTARRLWAVARARYRERGATLTLVPVTRWRTTAAAWNGEVLGVMRHGGLRDDEPAVGMLRLWSAGTHRDIYLPRAALSLAFTPDGQGFLHDDGDEVVQRDLLTGTNRRPLASPVKNVTQLRISGAGEDRRLLIADDRGISLWNRAGRLKYGSGGSRDWPIALSPDGSLQAIATIYNVEVSDHTLDGRRLLEPTWSDQPGLPVAMRFATNDRLVVVYSRGEIVTWDTRRGKPVRRHHEPDTRVMFAGISPDATTVATGHGIGFALRSVRTGRTLGTAEHHVLDTRSSPHYRLPERTLTLSPSGTLAAVDRDGGVSVWRPGDPIRVLEPSPLLREDWSGPRLSCDGKVLHFKYAGQSHVWDLATGRRVPWSHDPDEKLLALACDGERLVVRTREALVVRDAAGKQLHRRPIAPTDAASALAASSGHVVLAIGQPEQLEIVEPDGRSHSHSLGKTEPLYALSDDGRWLATGRFNDQRIWTRKSLDRPVRTLENSRHLTFSRDGKRIAWISSVYHPRWGVPTDEVHVEPLEGPATGWTLPLDGEARALAFTPDGDAVLALRTDNTCLRGSWAPPHATRSKQAVWISGWNDIRMFTDDDDPAPLATIRAWPSGDWLLMSRGGAVDGSDDVADELVTRVDGPGASFAFSGRLGWHGARVPGLISQLLAGKEIAPPVRND